ncbi:MAG: F0F1 ATP synthase subunit delta [Candidatus Omnitrophica bacterium]|nr:F0F1 ATP synthase subunit delta [Candidatus Omnitrophota bacterium]
MTIQLIIIQVVTFIALIIVLRILFHGQLDSALKRLKHLYEENLTKEEELKKRIEEIGVEREKELLKTRELAATIIKDAKGKAEKAEQDAILRAKDESKRVLGHAEGESEKMKDKMMAHAHEKAIELSVEMLKATFTDQGKETLQHQLISELIDEIKKVAKDKFTVKTKRVTILSAQALKTDEKAKLAQILKDKMNSAVDIDESVDKDIIAGLIIKIGSLTIDGSIRNKLRKVIPYLR